MQLNICQRVKYGNEATDRKNSLSFQVPFPHWENKRLLFVIQSLFLPLHGLAKQNVSTSAKCKIFF